MNVRLNGAAVIAALFIFLAGAALFVCFDKGIGVTARRRDVCNKYNDKYRLLVVSVLGGVLALLCVWYYRGQLAAALTSVFFLGFLTVVSLRDFDTMEIPNQCPALIFALAAVSCFTMPQTSMTSRFIGIVCVSAPMLFACLLMDGAFGGGDIKLMASGGAFLGCRLTVLAMVIAVLLAGVYILYLVIVKKRGRRTRFAFAPFLCAGMAISMFAGEALIEGYLAFFSA